MPADADTNNVYMVTIEADDGTYMDTYDVTIRVTDVDDTDGTLPGDSLLDEYDVNDNDRIDRSEIVTAIGDFIGGQLTRGQMVDIITLYLR